MVLYIVICPYSINLYLHKYWGLVANFPYIDIVVSKFEHKLKNYVHYSSMG